MWLYVSERRLLPCLMGHLALDLLPLMLLALHFPLLAGPPPALNPHTTRGMELMDRREYKQAIAEFDQALQENAKDATAYQGRGAAYTHQGEIARGIKDLDEAIRLAPSVAETYVNRSVAYRVKGDLPRALEDLTSAVNLRPSEPDYLYRRGAIYSLMGNHRKAIEDYSAMIALAPNSLYGYQARFSEYDEIRDY